jgi:CubicO group peptidase (beta-lactamase class C family)
MTTIVETSRTTSHDAFEFSRIAREIVARHPAVGLAIGIIRNGQLEGFFGHGFADVEARRPVTEETVFRIASVTKLFTAVAVMQLCEDGSVDLDAPAGDYLHSYRLTSADVGFRPATLRHLLTHTAGIPDVVRITDLLHPGWGSFESRPAAFSVASGADLPTLAEYYRGGLRAVIEPGTAFTYTNHGFATLGQIVEDVTGLTLDRYLRDRILEPLGMAESDLVRSDRVGGALATGYELGSHGAVPVPDREWITRGASSLYSTTRDMARFAAALLADGRGEHGKILEPGTLVTMFAPSFHPDPRLPGMGLGFFRSELGGRLVVGHDGRMPGFNAQLLIAPDDGVGIIGMTNGAPGAMSWLPIELERLLRRELGVPEDALRTDLPQRPETWRRLTGTYRLPERITDLRARLVTGGSVQVLVRGGRLTARLLSPIPALRRGFALVPDDERDPDLFRIDLSPYGMPLVRVAFSRREQDAASEINTDLAMLSFRRQPPPASKMGWRRWAVLGLIATAALMRSRRRRVG